MAVTNFHSRYGARVDVLATPAPVNIQMVRGNLTADPTVVADPTSGDIYPRHVAITGYKHLASWTTNALQDALDQVGLTGQVVANNGIIFHAQKFTEGSTAASGANHLSYTIAEGVHLGRRITCDHRGDAELDLEVVATYDGTNAPIVEATGATLPTAAADNERFTLGNITLESIAIAQVTNLEIDFGVQEVAAGSNSDVYDTFVAVRSLQPKITITSTDLTMLGSSKVPRTGLAITHANTTIYLRKRSTTASGFVADGTSEHIKITAAGMAVVREIFRDGDKEPAGVSIEVTCTYDGTNAPLVFDTTSTNV